MAVGQALLKAMQQEQLKILESPLEVYQLIEYLKDFEYVAYDTETTGLQRDCEIIGMSVAAEVEVGFYIPLAWWNVATQSLDYCPPALREACVKLLEFLKTKQLIMHNAIFDCDKTWLNFKVDLLDALHTDTMILAHLLNENERVGLKDLAASIFGESEKKEQEEMAASVIANGGIYLAKDKEMYKADKYILGKYGAKDTILTMKLFYHLVPILFDEGLDQFFYEDECMPLLKAATYQLNTTGLRVDIEKMQKLKADLEAEITMLEAKVRDEVYPYVKDKYPGTTPKNTFNIGASQQLAWLLFTVLDEEFKKLTDGGRKVAKDLMDKLPYQPSDKRRFKDLCVQAGLKPEKYMKCDKATLQEYEEKYTWIKRLLEYRKAEKILGTYVEGILNRLHYGCIYPGFKQTGTKGTRMSSNNPNFQNLPRDDKRVKACIIARKGRAFVGADYSQLEPRVFTAVSRDAVLIAVFKNKEDPYSAFGLKVFKKTGYSAKKGAPNFFGDAFPLLRQMSKEGVLAFAYGTTPFKFKETVRAKTKIDLPVDDCKEIRTNYFEEFEGVDNFVKETHEQIVTTGKVYNLFGRPRRIPEAKFIRKLDWKNPLDLPYEYRTLLNLAVNYRVQGTAGSIVNRACIAFCRKARALGLDAQIVMQIHDEIIVECADEIKEQVAAILKDCMENTCSLPGVDLIAEPKIAYNLADLK